GLQGRAVLPRVLEQAAPPGHEPQVALSRRKQALPKLFILVQRQVRSRRVGLAQQLSRKEGGAGEGFVSALAREDDLESLLAGQRAENVLANVVEVDVVVLAVVGSIDEVVGQGLLVDNLPQQPDAQPVGRALGDVALVEARGGG